MERDERAMHTCRSDHHVPGQQPALIVDATNRVLIAIHGRR